MSVNKVILIGNVGKEPEVRYLEGGIAVASFTLATTERGYKTQAGVQIPERTEWHNIIAWRGLAEIVEKYVKKGTQLYIEGKIRSRSWDDAQGVKHYVTEIYADNLQLLGSRSESNQNYAQNKSNGSQTQQNNAQTYQTNSQVNQNYAQTQSNMVSGADEMQNNNKNQTLSEQQSRAATPFSENNDSDSLPF
ncbi:MAG: single-stranded DNA-binding protein [Bacteroidales bacterium]|nr:single-stranded DNA-binding protein [Bacteroidales bacterium]